MNREALIVFAKVPVPGRVKTRLTALLSPEEAAEVYAAFLRDALMQYAGLGVALRLYVEPSEGQLPPDWLPSGAEVFPQRGEGLGARMQRAFLETFAAGYERIVIIGTDHPTLPDDFIVEAFNALGKTHSMVIGPSEDGGYYLLGMNEFYPELFEAMTYSHARVFEETLQRIGRTPARPTILPLWYDVDTPEALRRLAVEVEESSNALTHTRAVCDRLSLPERAR